jgi:hypothetical protein
MVRKLVELTKFLVFNSRTKSFGSSSIFAFYLLLFALIQMSVFAFWAIGMGLVTFLCPHFRWSWMITPTSTLPMMGDCVPWASIAQGFPRVLYDALIHLGYDGDAPVHRCWLYMVQTWTGARLAWWYPSTLQSHGRVLPSAAIPTPALRWWRTSLSPPCARTASLLWPHCLSHFSQFGIRRTPYGSSALRLCPPSE